MARKFRKLTEAEKEKILELKNKINELREDIVNGTTIWLRFSTKEMLDEYESPIIKSNNAKIRVLMTVYDYVVTSGYSIPPDLLMKKKKWDKKEES